MSQSDTNLHGNNGESSNNGAQKFNSHENFLDLNAERDQQPAATSSKEEPQYNSDNMDYTDRVERSNSNISNNSNGSGTNLLDHRGPGEGMARKKKSNTTLASGRTPNPRQRTTWATFGETVFVGLLKLLKDLAAFLIRGGLSSMMFLMDQALSLGLMVTSVVPGGVYVDAAARTMMWMFQIAMWVVYTAIELNFYLPWRLLALYIPLLMIAYLFMPEFMHTALSTMLRLVHWFLHLVKSYVYAPMVG